MLVELGEKTLRLDEANTPPQTALPNIRTIRPAVGCLALEVRRRTSWRPTMPVRFCLTAAAAAAAIAAVDVSSWAADAATAVAQTNTPERREVHAKAELADPPDDGRGEPSPRTTDIAHRAIHMM
jgi:hypothetical protein